jgi:hypothetical protein
MPSGGSTSSRTPPPASGRIARWPAQRRRDRCAPAGRARRRRGSLTTSTRLTSTPVSGAEQPVAGEQRQRVADRRRHALPRTRAPGNPPSGPSGSTGCGPSTPAPARGPLEPGTVATCSVPSGPPAAPAGTASARPAAPSRRRPARRAPLPAPTVTRAPARWRRAAAGGRGAGAGAPTDPARGGATSAQPGRGAASGDPQAPPAIRKAPMTTSNPRQNTTYPSNGGEGPRLPRPAQLRLRSRRHRHPGVVGPDRPHRRR